MGANRNDNAVPYQCKDGDNWREINQLSGKEMWKRGYINFHYYFSNKYGSRKASALTIFHRWLRKQKGDSIPRVNLEKFVRLFKEHHGRGTGSTYANWDFPVCCMYRHENGRFYPEKPLTKVQRIIMSSQYRDEEIASQIEANFPELEYWAIHFLTHQLKSTLKRSLKNGNQI